MGFETALHQNSSSPLERIFRYIAQHSPQGARHIRDRIGQIEALLIRVPMAGQETTKVGMRRLVATPFPYCVFYRIGENEIVIHGVRHTSRRPLSGL